MIIIHTLILQVFETRGIELTTGSRQPSWILWSAFSQEINSNLQHEFSTGYPEQVQGSTQRRLLATERGEDPAAAQQTPPHLQVSANLPFKGQREQEK